MATPRKPANVGGATGLTAVLLRPVRGGTSNAFEATVEQLAAAIRLGVFAEGDHLPPERALAAAMGISRATLREAMAALRQAGLVATRSGRGGGSVVTARQPGSKDDDAQTRRAEARALVESEPDRFRDALVARRVVEPGAALVAAGAELTSDQRQWLRQALAEVVNATDSATHRQADSRLHLAVATLSGSRRLLDLIADLQRDLDVMLSAIPVLEVNIAHSTKEHNKVVEAILTGDGSTARAVMECHCDATAALLRGLLGMDHSPPRRDGTH